VYGVVINLPPHDLFWFIYKVPASWALNIFYELSN